jgi:glyoxylase-like metal-dependent hydrolase (beta-lactamase superfamily II)
MSRLKLQHFYDKSTFSLTYVIHDENTLDAIIIDPVLNYDPASSITTANSVDELINYVDCNKLKPNLILETHAHADHLSGAYELKKIFKNSKVGIGKGIIKVQEVFKEIYNLDWFEANGEQFDLLLEDESIISSGSIKVRVITTPGHTPACVSFQIEDMVFTGDALFMPDYGTGRCDFPQGSAKELYHSIDQKLYKLADHTRFFTGHDYCPNGRDLRFEATIGESKNANIQLKSSTEEVEFINFRNSRDATLSEPKLLLPSIQININGGRMPKLESNGVSYLKIPIKMGDIKND